MCVYEYMGHHFTRTCLAACWKSVGDDVPERKRSRGTGWNLLTEGGWTWEVTVISQPRLRQS